MSINFDITSSDNAHGFLIDTLKLKPEELVMEYLVECTEDVDLFVERNRHRLKDMDIHDVHFIAFHVTASLDDCAEIKENGIRDLQYVLSHNTKLTKKLNHIDIKFDIKKRLMYVDGKCFNIDYEHYRKCRVFTSEEKQLEAISHRIYYDFCVDGFWANEHIEGYGTDIHKRPEFISKLIELSPKAKKLDAFWRDKSKPYKIFFFATADQIQKFTFDLKKDCNPYTKDEQESIKDWMLRKAIDQAFDSRGEDYIYIRDYQHIPPEQIIKYEEIRIK